MRGYGVAMSSTLQVRGLADAARRALEARAAARGESLNAYVPRVLDREVARPTVAEVLEGAAARSERTAVSSTEIIAAARAQRDEQLGGRARR